MKKLLLAALAALITCAASAQTTYRFDAIQGGGFYLVEMVKDTAGRVNEFPQRFNTQEQLNAFVVYLRDQSASAVKQADKILADAQNEAKKLKDAAPRLSAASESIEQVAKVYFSGTTAPPMVVYETYPSPKPVKPPKAKTTPKPKKKTKKQ